MLSSESQIIHADNWKELCGQTKYSYPAQFHSEEDWKENWKDTKWVCFRLLCSYVVQRLD